MSPITGQAAGSRSPFEAGGRGPDTRSNGHLPDSLSRSPRGGRYHHRPHKAVYQPGPRTRSSFSCPDRGASARTPGKYAHSRVVAVTRRLRVAGHVPAQLALGHLPPARCRPAGNSSPRPGRPGRAPLRCPSRSTSTRRSARPMGSKGRRHPPYQHRGPRLSPRSWPRGGRHRRRPPRKAPWWEREQRAGCREAALADTISRVRDAVAAGELTVRGRLRLLSSRLARWHFGCRARGGRRA